MAFRKSLKINSLILFLLLAFYPFGQLLRINLPLGDTEIPLLALDCIVFLSAIFCMREPFKSKTRLAVWFLPAVFVFSQAVFIGTHGIAYLPGVLYLIRLFAYLSLFYLVYYARRERGGEYLLRAFLLVFVFSALFGLFQYFFYPDIRALTFWGWDDHYLRLAGTFLDPGFTSIIMVFGMILSFGLYRVNRLRRFLFAAVLFAVCLLLTYSRAGYLAGVVGLIGFLPKKAVFVIVGFALIAVFAVSSMGDGEGVRLGRTVSIWKRAENYSQTIGIIKNSPVFGVGYNNMCLVRQKLFNDDPRSHSCGGSDSSLLLIVADAGVVGLVVFLYTLFSLCASLKSSKYKQVFAVSMAALLVHSLFVNSLFYPWVLVWMVYLYAVSYPVKA